MGAFGILERDLFRRLATRRSTQRLLPQRGAVSSIPVFRLHALRKSNGLACLNHGRRFWKSPRFNGRQEDRILWRRVWTDRSRNTNSWEEG